MSCYTAEMTGEQRLACYIGSGGVAQGEGWRE